MDEMNKLGWYLSGLQNPNGVHFCVTMVHANIEGFVEMFERDLCQSLENVKLNPTIESSNAKMYRSNQSFGIKEFVPQLTREYWNILGKTDKKFKI